MVQHGTNLSVSATIPHIPREAGKWFNDDCSALKNFVCYHDGGQFCIFVMSFGVVLYHQALLSIVVITLYIIVVKDSEEYPEELDDPACGPGWFRHADHCYMINDDTMAYSEAQQHCHDTADNAELLFITTREEQLFIQGKLVRNSLADLVPDYLLFFYAVRFTS